MSKSDSSPSACFETLMTGCNAILHRLENDVPQHYAETVEELESRHDKLHEEVCNIVGMLRSLAEDTAALAKARGEQS